jgi:hypothetical protein
MYILHLAILSPLSLGQKDERAMFKKMCESRKCHVNAENDSTGLEDKDLFILSF